MLIAIEGLPGAGKTTSAKLLAARLKGTSLRETTADHPFLQSVYDDAERYDLQVELGFLLLHQASYRAIASKNTVVADFSPAKDLFFAKAMLSEEDLHLFETLYHRLYEGLSLPQTVLFLDAPPELCLARVRQRREADPARAFEADMTIERLRLMQRMYEERLQELGARVLRLPVSAHMTKSEVLEASVEILLLDNPDLAVTLKG